MVKNGRTKGEYRRTATRRHGQSFGGDWTQEKLDRLTKYLRAYTVIFHANPWARFYHTFYVDAFAGAGYIHKVGDPLLQPALFPELAEEEAQRFIKGSAVRALEVEPQFKEYLFIERDPERCEQLEGLKQIYPGRAITVKNAEANQFLHQWCKETDWKRTRAVVFLDPYGMQIEWALLEEIGRTRGIDLWFLFPLGAAVMRLLTRREPPPEAWANSLTRVAGTDEWRQRLYRQRQEETLFGTEELEERQAGYEGAASFFLERLKLIFARVANNPYVLRNSKNCPLYLFCFAAGNPKGASTAVKIAQHILRE